MSRRKKKLYARKYQPWYYKKAAVAQSMEDALAPRPEPPRRSPTGGDSKLSAGTANAAGVGGSFVFQGVAADSYAGLEQKLERIKEGMKRWHKAIRRSENRSVKVRGAGRR